MDSLIIECKIYDRQSRIGKTSSDDGLYTSLGDFSMHDQKVAPRRSDIQDIFSILWLISFLAV